MGDQPRLEWGLIKNRRCRFDELEDVLIVADARIKLGARMPVIEAAVIKGVDLPIGHLIGTPPRHGTGSDRDAFRLARRE